MEKKEDKVEKKDKSKSIADLTKSSKKIDGLFPIFQDTINGKLKMVISKDQFQEEFIYFSQIADGVVEAGRYRGSYQNEIIFYIKNISIKLNLSLLIQTILTHLSFVKIKKCKYK